MSGIFNFNRMHVQEMSTYRVTVPDDDIARLMYYLSCVDTVINYQEIDRLSDYKNYASLTHQELVLLFKLVMIFNPEYFVEKGVFIINQNLLPYDLDNQFYQITDERIGIHVNSEMSIGGRTVKILRVMACNMDWLIRYYFKPWQNIFETANRMERYKRVQVPPPPQPNIFFVPIEAKKRRPSPREEKDVISCCILF